MAQTRKSRDAEHWRILGLTPGAPACVVKVAHLRLARVFHPDVVGGDAQKAKMVNVAKDEVLAKVTPAREWVSESEGSEPNRILGLLADADAALVERAARALSKELASFPKVVERVAWASAHFGDASLRAPHVRKPTRTPIVQPRAESSLPNGWVKEIDVSGIKWGSHLDRVLKLTWPPSSRPTSVTVRTSPPIICTTTKSRSVAGQWIIAVSIDWGMIKRQAFRMNSWLEIRWSGGQGIIGIVGAVAAPVTESTRAAVQPQPSAPPKRPAPAPRPPRPSPPPKPRPSPPTRPTAKQTPSKLATRPLALDLGVVALDKPTRASLTLQSAAAVRVTVVPPAWLLCVRGAQSFADAEYHLRPNTPVRIEFVVAWLRIREAERKTRSFSKGKPARASGVIAIKSHDGNRISVPVHIVVEQDYARSKGFRAARPSRSARPIQR